jgi:uncharacterized membrane protein YjdF
VLASLRFYLTVIQFSFFIPTKAEDSLFAVFPCLVRGLFLALWVRIESVKNARVKSAKKKTEKQAKRGEKMALQERGKSRAVTGIYIGCIVLSLALLGYAYFERAGRLAFLVLLFLATLPLPRVVAAIFRRQLPPALEIGSLIFVFSAGVLGEIVNLYYAVPFWDSLLHLWSGFLLTIFALSLVEGEKWQRAIFAICFAISVGVLWELFEWGADVLIGTDMQKDTILTHITSTFLGNGQKSSLPIIRETVIDGTPLPFEGYLDIGLYDTMSDLAFDTLGAISLTLLWLWDTAHRNLIARCFLPMKKENKTERA